MNRLFVVLISGHRKFGELLLPFIVTKVAGKPFYEIYEMVSKSLIDAADFPYTISHRKLFSRFSEITEQGIHIAFGKKKSIKEFVENIDEITLNYVRNYLDRRIGSIYDELFQSDIPIFLRDKVSKVIHDDSRVYIPKDPVQVVFNFIKEYDQLKYFLTVRIGNKNIQLSKSVCQIIAYEPCILLIDSFLCKIPNLNAKKLLPFFKKDFIQVPLNTQKVYFETFIKPAIENYEVNASGFEIREFSGSKSAVLHIETDLKYEPAFCLYFQYGDVSIESKDERNIIVLTEEYNDSFRFLKITRDIIWETSIIKTLFDYGVVRDNGNYFKLTELANPNYPFQSFIQWINQNSMILPQNGIDLIKKTSLKDYFTGTVDLQLDVKQDNDWFDVYAMVCFGDFKIPFVKLRKYILNDIREFTLPNGEIAVLPDAWFDKYKDLLAVGKDQDNNIRLEKHHFGIVTSIDEGVHSDEIEKLQQSLTLFDENEIELPDGIQATLRPYQKKGYFWMQQLYRNGFGGCLADDMGLGKTLQTIALLLYIKDAHLRKVELKPLAKNLNGQLSLFDAMENVDFKSFVTSLIVMPVSLIHNWERELKRFAPSLRVQKYTGTLKNRHAVDIENTDIVLASYGIVRNDVDYLSTFNFTYIILDESQYIKNAVSKSYQSVLKLKSKYRMVLTGTPIENSLTDLWTQMNFVNPNLLGSLNYFIEEYVHPIERRQNEQQQQRLQQLISPFILRRKKEDVVPELPPITEQVVFCEMTDEQSEIYENERSKVRNAIMESIDEGGMGKSSFLILKALNKLRLLSNHPALTDSEYTGDSGKYDEILRNIDSVIEGNHKLLIFSFYVKHLELISKYISSKAYKFVTLTGRMSALDRRKAIDEFQNSQEASIFLISLNAGGTGINLTAADYVFILDPWWNPAREEQAISRAHRIGQEKSVFVYRFITLNSIEEKIQLLQKKKSGLAETFINSNNPFRQLDKEDIYELLN